MRTSQRTWSRDTGVVGARTVDRTDGRKFGANDVAAAAAVLLFSGAVGYCRDDCDDRAETIERTRDVDLARQAHHTFFGYKVWIVIA